MRVHSNLRDRYSLTPQSHKILNCDHLWWAGRDHLVAKGGMPSQRLNRLKSYALIGECPPDEFLQECQSDPVLTIQLKRMASQKLVLAR
ncbi:hypothetical protein [Nostoc sp.]|uniref:hypothetical protein n=1 Tax=Nostoc sp. TaxID=1180 RepID=UPI002FF587B3